MRDPVEGRPLDDAPARVVTGRRLSRLERWGVSAGIGAAFWVLLEIWAAV